MEGTVIHVVNRYVIVTPAFPPLAILRDRHGNTYLVVSSESAYARYMIKALDAIKELEDEIKAGRVNVELGIAPENTSKAILIGDVTEYPKAGEKVQLVAYMDQLTSDEVAVVTPFGPFDPWRDRMTHLTIFGRTGVGKSVLVLYLILHAVSKGYKAVILDYHGEYREAAEDFAKRGLRVIYYDVPKVNLCRTPPEVLAAIFGILPVLDKAPKMAHYMQLMARLACEAPAEIRQLFDNPVELIKAIAETIILINWLESRCGSKLDIPSKPDPVQTKLCQVKSYVQNKLTPFEYNLLKDLVKERDRESLESLYRYMSVLNLFKNIVSLNEDVEFEGYDVVIINLSIALSQTSFAIPIAIHVINKVFNSAGRIVLFIEEAPALFASEYIRNAAENIVRQGRKFGIFVVIVTQMPLEIMAQTALVLGNIANARYIKEVQSRVPHMADPLRFVLTILRPWYFVYIDNTGNIIPVRILRKVAKHSASEL